MNLFLTGNPIDILIVTYNRLEFTSYCLGSLISNTSYPIHLIVVDNASTDGTREYVIALKEKGLIHKLILNDLNAGIAIPKNQGLEQFLWQENYCIISDSDIAFHKSNPDWIQTINQTMVHHPKLAMVSPDCDPINAISSEQQWWWDKRQYKKNDLAIIPTGFWATMIRKDVIQKIKEKNQDEVFKCRSLYGETDEQFRNIIQSMGYWIGVCLKTRIYNLGWDDKYRYPDYHMWKKQQRWKAEEARRAEGG